MKYPKLEIADTVVISALRFGSHSTAAIKFFDADLREQTFSADDFIAASKLFASPSTYRRSASLRKLAKAAVKLIESRGLMVQAFQTNADKYGNRYSRLRVSLGGRRESGDDVWFRVSTEYSYHSRSHSSAEVSRLLAAVYLAATGTVGPFYVPSHANATLGGELSNAHTFATGSVPRNWHYAEACIVTKAQLRDLRG